MTPRPKRRKAREWWVHTGHVLPIPHKAALEVCDSQTEKRRPLQCCTDVFTGKPDERILVREVLPAAKRKKRPDCGCRSMDDRPCRHGNVNGYRRKP